MNVCTCLIEYLTSSLLVLPLLILLLLLPAAQLRQSSALLEACGALRTTSLSTEVNLLLVLHAAVLALDHIKLR